jgi:hypothetical protein
MQKIIKESKGANMHLRKNPENVGIHGVDYIKGLEDGRHCGKFHPYNTVRCRPVLYVEDGIFESEYKFVNYDSLTDKEKLELGEPLFFGSPLHRAITNVKIRNTIEEVNFDVYGQEVSREVTVETSKHLN